MKLSKKSLETIIRAAIDMEGESHFAFHVLESLRNDCLEIEGYKRKDHLRDTAKMVDGWTRFDPNDESTHPTKIDGYLAYFSFGVVQITSWDGKNLGFASSDRRYITHWQPLPPPPVETEAGK